MSKVLTEQKERSMLFNDGWTFNLGDVQGAKEKEFNDHINNLIVITYNFCRDYVDNSNMNKTQ